MWDRYSYYRNFSWYVSSNKISSTFDDEDYIFIITDFDIASSTTFIVNLSDRYRYVSEANTVTASSYFTVHNFVNDLDSYTIDNMYYSYSNTAVIHNNNGSSNINNISKVCIEETIEIDSYIDTVTSTNRSAYPDNGVIGSYLYQYQGLK